MTLMFMVVGAIIVIVIVGLIGQISNQAKGLQRPEDLTDADIRQLVRQGRRIQAIAGYRVLHGVGLKAAKAAIDDMAKHLE
jgi:ribosomal protein L7/L12